MKYIIISTILLMALFVVGCTQTGNGVTGNTVQSANVGGSDSESTLKTFKIVGENFKFSMDGIDNPDIIVNKGDTVKIEFSSVGGFHDWVVDEFNAHTQQINSGASASVEFIADETGEFEYYCSVGQHRQKGMKGKLIVR